MIVASVDAAQCYDRMAHAMMALVSRAGKVPKSSVNCMLQPLREMEFYFEVEPAQNRKAERSTLFMTKIARLKLYGVQHSDGPGLRSQELRANLHLVSDADEGNVRLGMIGRGRGRVSRMTEPPPLHRPRVTG